MVWCGVEFNGVDKVRCGVDLVKCSVVWSGVEWCGVWCSVV